MPSSLDSRRRQVRLLSRLTLAVLVVGLLWRLLRFALCFPIWGDEAMLLVNYARRDYLDFFGPIENGQIAPLFFHWAELTAIRCLGPHEFAVRLPSLLAGLGSLALFWMLLRQTLPRLARVYAVCILAVSIWPATMGSLAKPYTFDLFFALALLVPATRYLRRPERQSSLWLLVATVPVALLSSYPAVFVAGAIWLILCRSLWRTCRSAYLVPFACYSLLLGGTFLAHYLLVSLPHLSSSAFSTTASDFMADYWKNGFPPGDVLGNIRWLFLGLTGQIAAYPVGAANGGSILTAILVVFGGRYLYQRRRHGLLLLFAATLGLSLLAAILHKYPFGASCRLAQHLAPFYCALAGVGAMTLVQRARSVQVRIRLRFVVPAVLLLVGTAGIARDVLHPYRDNESRWAREFVSRCVHQAGRLSVVMIDEPREIPSVIQWQSVQQGVVHVRLDELSQVQFGAFWLLQVHEDGDECTLPEMLQTLGWKPMDTINEVCVPERRERPRLHGSLSLWVRRTE